MVGINIGRNYDQDAEIQKIKESLRNNVVRRDIEFKYIGTNCEGVKEIKKAVFPYDLSSFSQFVFDYVKQDFLVRPFSGRYNNVFPIEILSMAIFLEKNYIQFVDLLEGFTCLDSLELASGFIESIAYGISNIGYFFNREFIEYTMYSTWGKRYGSLSGEPQKVKKSKKTFISEKIIVSKPIYEDNHLVSTDKEEYEIGHLSPFVKEMVLGFSNTRRHRFDYASAEELDDKISYFQKREAEFEKFNRILRRSKTVADLKESIPELLKFARKVKNKNSSESYYFSIGRRFGELGA